MIAPANTGRDNNKSTAVITTAQANKGILCKLIPLALILINVLMKFIAPSIELIPLKCNEKMARSTAPPEWALIDDNGGYQIVLAG